MLSLSPQRSPLGWWLNVAATTIKTRITQALVGQVLYPETAGETSANATLYDQSYPPYCAERYSAGFKAGNSAAQNAAALQDAINSAAQAGAGIVTIATRGSFSIDASALYFHYDATNNPNFPSDNHQQGNIILRGQGFMDSTAWANGIDQGTILDVGSDTLTFGLGVSASNGLRGCRLEYLTVVGDNDADVLVRFNFCSRGTGVDQFSVFNSGNGGGFEFSDCFLIACGYWWAETDTDLGIGMRVYNPTQAAGMYDLGVGTVRGFAKGAMVGKEATSGASSISQVRGFLQAIACGEGIICARGAKDCRFDLHIESNTTTGFRAWYGATGITLESVYANQTAATESQISLGKSGEADSSNNWQDVHINLARFVTVPANKSAIEVFLTASCQNFSWRTLVATQETAGTGYVIDFNGTSSLHGARGGLIRTGNAFSANINGSANVDFYYDADTLGRKYQQAPITVTGISDTMVNVASGTDLSWINTGNIWRITGTTTINTIAAPTNGNPRLTLLFTGNVTVQDLSTAAGNLALAGSADFGATSQDVLELFWDGNSSVWRESSRSVD